MILAAHIVIALTSILISALSYLAPSKSKFRISYIFIGLTIGSGSYLIVEQKASMIRVCMMGLLFTSFSLISVALARRKLARETVDS